MLAAQPAQPAAAPGGVGQLVRRAPAGAAQLGAQLGRDAVGQLRSRDPQGVDGLARGSAGDRPVLAVDVDALVDVPGREALVEQPLEGRDVAAAHQRRLQAEGPRRAGRRRGTGDRDGVVVVVGPGSGRPGGAQSLLPDPRAGQDVVAVALRRGARAVVGDHAGTQAHAADIAGEELEPDADVGTRLPAAAELVGAILQAGARRAASARRPGCQAPGGGGAGTGGSCPA